MPSQYHNAIQSAIINFGNKHTKVERVRGSGQPIHINHPTKNKAILYYPDVRFELRSRKIIIFEVLDTQSEDKTIADLIRSVLTQNATQIYFIVKTNEIAEKIVRIYEVILSKFADEFKIWKRKLLEAASVIVISEEDAKDEEFLEYILSNEIFI